MKFLLALLTAAEIALFLAPIPIWPYLYYQLLRVLVFVTCCCLLYWIHRGTAVLIPHRAFVLLIACVFNPFVILEIHSTMWLPIDLVAGTYFIALSQAVRKQL